jgi:hypothetical protein
MSDTPAAAAAAAARLQDAEARAVDLLATAGRVAALLASGDVPAVDEAAALTTAYLADVQAVTEAVARTIHEVADAKERRRAGGEEGSAARPPAAAQ